jgi:hypothetical protein
MSNALRVRLPEEVLSSESMRADGKILFGVVGGLADAQGVVQTSVNSLAHAAWTTERAAARWLGRFTELGLVADVENTEGLLFFTVQPPASRLLTLSIPHSVLGWPHLAAEAQLVYALLAQRAGPATQGRVWIVHSELGLRLGRVPKNASSAGVRSLKALAQRGLVKVLQTYSRPRGESQLELPDAERVWRRHVAAARKAYRRQTA